MTATAGAASNLGDRVFNSDKPARPRRGFRPSDELVGHCKLCQGSVWPGEDRVWSRDPLGLVHTRCLPAGEGG